MGLSFELNACGQPVGLAVDSWQGAQVPERMVLEGCFCRLEPLEVARHAAELYQALQLDARQSNWTYLDMPAERTAFIAWLEAMQTQRDPLFFVIVDGASGKPVGLASYLRIDAANGVIEVGWLHYSPLLQRTPAATEAMYLMMRRAFDELGYRRYEWKCDAL
ncbi:MAG: GNAT family N-acetyltransferase, partial [Pseudogulbenkiania sp.]|nr:GNAT family N-acetyltransferase [Pseudogulbenkiania sp.]